MKFLILLFAMALSSTLFAETLHLLDIPLSEGPAFSYTVNLVENCSFKDVREIELKRLDEKASTLSEKINKLQREVNLDIVEKKINQMLITMKLKGATNLEFEFYFDKNCDLIKVIKMDDKKYHFKSIDAEYLKTLGTPVLKKMIIHAEEQELILYPWALHDSNASYELEAGGGFEILENIRTNDKTAFHKTDPIYGPVGIFSFRYGPFFINYHGAGSLIYNNKKLSVFALATLEGENYKSINLKDRKQGVFLGTLINYNFLEFTYYNDFFDHEKGLNFKLNISPIFYYQTQWSFNPQFYTQYWNNKYVDYYYGVAPAESLASGLKFYKGTHSINYGVALEIDRYIGRWTFITEINAKYFGKEVYTSPTVSKKHELKITSGVLYKFF